MYKKNSLIFSTMLFISIVLIGCNNNVTENIDNSEVISDKTIIEQMAKEDSSIISFETNYDEQGSLDFLFGKVSGDIFPIRVVRRISNVNMSYTTDIIGDTSYVTVSYIFTGSLVIAASYDSISFGDTTNVDTLITKPFSSTISRKLIFTKIANTQNPRLNWRLIAISLSEGGIVTQNIAIQKMTFYLANDTLVITSPTDYYLSRGIGRGKQIPIIGRNERSTVYVEIFSAYPTEDFVTLTYGADIRGLHRVKRRFILDSMISSGNGYLKTYKLTFTPLPFIGHSHAVITAMPRIVVFDDQTVVESKSWGLPYYVR